MTNIITNSKASANYYKSILHKSWHGFDEQVEWFSQRCDSRLEVIVGLSLLGLYKSYALISNRFNPPANSPDAPHYVYLAFLDDKITESEHMIELNEDHIQLHEPFTASPSSIGHSTAFLTCQFQDLHKWDFCIHAGNDNGSTFKDEDSTPCLLVDIDGYGIHRNQRNWDIIKLERSSMPAIRMCEERFTSHWQMAAAIIWKGLFVCGCPEYNSYKSCEWCDDLESRVICKSKS